MVRAAQEAVMHRPNFAIDAIGDSDGEDESPEDDSGVMAEVEAFLKAHGGPDDENAVTGSQKKAAQGEWICRRLRGVWVAKVVNSTLLVASTQNPNVVCTVKSPLLVYCVLCANCAELLHAESIGTPITPTARKNNDLLDL